MNAADNIIKPAPEPAGENNKNDKKSEMNGNVIVSPEKKEEDKIAPPTKRQRIMNKISYGDLKEDEDVEGMQQLELSKVCIFELNV